MLFFSPPGSSLDPLGSGTYDRNREGGQEGCPGCWWHVEEMV